MGSCLSNEEYAKKTFSPYFEDHHFPFYVDGKLPPRLEKTYVKLNRVTTIVNEDMYTLLARDPNFSEPYIAGHYIPKQRERIWKEKLGTIHFDRRSAQRFLNYIDLKEEKEDKLRWTILNRSTSIKKDGREIIAAIPYLAIVLCKSNATRDTFIVPLHWKVRSFERKYSPTIPALLKRLGFENVDSDKRLIELVANYGYKDYRYKLSPFNTFAGYYMINPDRDQVDAYSYK